MKFQPKEVVRVRKLFKMTQGSLAVKAGINVTTLRLLETGKKEPMVSTLCMIAEALDMPIQSFFE